jgi:hypothetical protein
MLVQPILIDRVINDDLKLAHTRTELALVRVSDYYPGLVQFILVTPDLAPVTTHARRVEDEEHVERRGLGVGHHLEKLWSPTRVRARLEVRVEAIRRAKPPSLGEYSLLALLHHRSRAIALFLRGLADEPAGS